MFIIDFDDTLYDTQTLKKEMLKMVRPYGVSDSLFWETYGQARKSDDNIFTYTFEKHAHILAHYKFDEENILLALKTIEERMHDFILPGAIELLEMLDGLEQKMVLLSLGDAYFQQLKLKNLDIKKYFTEIHWENKTKLAVIKNIVQNCEDTIYLINDKPEETKEIKGYFPHIEIIMKQSDSSIESAYQNTGLVYFHNLEEIKDYVTCKLG